MSARPAPLMRDPVVRRVSIAYAMSTVGTAMSAVAVAFVAYVRTESVVLTAVALAGNVVPALLLAPFSARLLTGFSITRVVAAGQAAKALIWATAALTAALGELSYPVLLLANYAYGSVAAVLLPAWPRLAELVAPPGRLADLTALFKAIPAGSSVAGALLGGVILATLGHTWVFAIDAVSYLPEILVLLTLPAYERLPRSAGGALRAGIRYLMRAPELRRAFLLAAALNFAALPVLSVLPAVAHEIDARGHVLGLLTGAFYAGGALVAWTLIRLGRRFAYSQILFAGFGAAGLLLIANAALTDWRDPGLDAVAVAVATLVPIGLAVAVNASLLQALVLLACPDRVKAGVLVLYVGTASVITPLGGILLGVAVDMSSLWAPVAVSGLMLTVLAVALRRRLRVFDALQPAGEAERIRPALGGHWHTHGRYSAGADMGRPTHPYRFTL